MHKILITGASGLIGGRLTELLLKDDGYQVKHLGRTRKNGRAESFTWDVERHIIEPEAFDGVETVVHLAGAGIADKPWSAKRKQEIIESRTHSTRLLFDFLKRTNHSVTTFVSASAIGYYGFDNDHKLFCESDQPGTDFLANVVKKWEEEVDQISKLGIRVVKVRVGIVLSKDAGALHEMIKPIKFYVGAPLGNGKQKMSWIHIDDLCRVFMKGITDVSMAGPINGVGPCPVTNRELTKAIAKRMGRPLILPAVPAFVLKLFLGQMADLVLKGNSVSNEKLKELGFEYKFGTLEKALDNLLT
jgi:uncharacterized protein